MRHKLTEVCKRAGHLTWLKSISGVTIEEPRDMYPYMWGEIDISDEMVNTLYGSLNQLFGLIANKIISFFRESIPGVADLRLYM